MDVSYQIVNVATELANNGNDVVYFNSVSNVCDLLTLLISGKNSFNYKNAKQMDEGKLQRSASSNDLFNGYELSYGAFLTLADNEASSTQIIESMCNNVKKYIRAWKLLFLVADNKIHTIDNIVSRYLTKLYYCFLTNDDFRTIFIQQLNLKSLLSYIEFPSMATFFEELFLVTTQNNDDVIQSDNITNLILSKLFVTYDDNVPFNTSKLLMKILTQGSYDINACDKIKNDIYENKNVATHFIGKAIEQVQNHVHDNKIKYKHRNNNSRYSKGEEEAIGLGFYALDVMIALVKAYDGGCVVVRNNNMDEGKWDDSNKKKKKNKYEDCQISELPFFNVLLVQIGQLVAILQELIDDDDNGDHCPVYCMKITIFLSSLVRLECSYIDDFIMKHDILNIFVKLFFKYLKNNMLLAQIVNTFTVLLLNKNPITSELLSYRRKENDTLRRLFLDETNFISNSIKILDKGLKLPNLDVLSKRSHRSNSFEEKNQQENSNRSYLKTSNVVFNKKNLSIVEGKASLIYMLNVIDQGIEKIKNLKTKNWLKHNMKKLNLLMYMKEEGPFDKNEEELGEELKRQVSDDFINDDLVFDCDGFQLDDDQNIVNYSPTNSPLSSPTNKHQVDNSYFERNLKKYGFSNDGDDEDDDVMDLVKKETIVTKETATLNHSARMKRRSFLNNDDDDDDDEYHGLRRNNKQKVGKVIFNLPSTELSSSDEDEDGGDDDGERVNVYKK
jgi:hypothetical protein